MTPTNLAIDDLHAAPATDRPERITIGYLAPQFPGQTSIFLWREIVKLREFGCDVRLISTRPSPVATCRHPELLALVPQTHYLMGFHPGDILRAILTRPGGFLRAIRLWREVSSSPREALQYLAALIYGAGLLGYAERHGLKHVHVQSCANAAMMAAFSRRMGGPSYSMTLLNPLSVHGPHQVQKWRDAAFGIVLTRALLREVRETLGPDLPARVEVAPLGVDPDRFCRPQGTSYRPWSGNGPFQIFSCARLHPCKRHDDLIRAVGIARSRGYDIRLAIAGTADAFSRDHPAKLRSLISELGLGEHVELLGPLSEQAIIDRLCNAHVFALLSEAEPLGVVYIEAMAMELPVIATDAGGVPEVIESGRSGLLVPPGRPDLAANAILTIMHDAELAREMGTQGRRTVVERFSSAISAQILADAARAIVAAD
jgi:colanic acid/amylovoran biosynthesis glycosyltransferase